MTDFAATLAQPDAEFIAMALQEENERLQGEIIGLNGHRIYLVAMLKQLQKEFREARDNFEMEKMTLTVRIQELEGAEGIQPESGPDS